MTKRSRGSELYQMVQDYKEWLDRSPADSWMGQFKRQWEKIQPDDYEHESLTSPDPNPIHDLLDMIRDGQYPPPEYLLMLHTVFGEYFAGIHDLETSAFGPPVKKAGNFAARKYKLTQLHLLQTQLYVHIQNGYSPIQAATKMAADMYLDKDPRSLLKELRAHDWIFKEKIGSKRKQATKHDAKKDS